jgi:Flp pilus assembly protein TadD
MARLWDAATGMPLGPPIPHPHQVFSLAFSPDGNYLLTGANDHGERLFQMVPELPDDLDRIATWMEVLTGLTLDAAQGTIQVLDNIAWRKRREQLEQRGGPPETEGGRRFDPIPFGIDPLARGRTLIDRGQWDEAVDVFDQVVRARPYNASSWIARGGFRITRGQAASAAADYAMAIRLQPENLRLRYFHALSLLSQGDRAGLREACSDLLNHFGGSTSSLTANDVAWYCVLAPDAVADHEAPVRLAELAVSGASQAQKPMYLNTLGAALYRAGRFHEAISCLEEGIRLSAGVSSVQDWTFLALAHHRLSHDVEAHSWLERIRTYRPKERTQDAWIELEIHLLRGEAESVILYDPAFPFDPFSRD